MALPCDSSYDAWLPQPKPYAAQDIPRPNRSHSSGAKGFARQQ